MKGFGIVLMVCGALAGLGALGMDTSVYAGMGRRVHNLGLIQQQQNMVLLGAAAFIAGALLVALASRNASARGQGACADNHTFWPAEKERSLTQGEYRLYLVEKYGIRKNDTLGQFVLDKKTYNDLNSALYAAHKRDVAGSEIVRRGKIGVLDSDFVQFADGSVLVTHGEDYRRGFQTMAQAEQVEGPVHDKEAV